MNGIHYIEISTLYLHFKQNLITAMISLIFMKYSSFLRDKTNFAEFIFYYILYYFNNTSQQK